MHFFLLEYFHPKNYGFVSCLPLTEHVQSLYWACADIIDPVCDRFDGWLWLWLNSNRDIDWWVLYTWESCVARLVSAAGEMAFLGFHSHTYLKSPSKRTKLWTQYSVSSWTSFCQICQLVHICWIKSNKSWILTSGINKQILFSLLLFWCMWGCFVSVKWYI